MEQDKGRLGRLIQRSAYQNESSSFFGRVAAIRKAHQVNVSDQQPLDLLNRLCRVAVCRVAIFKVIGTQAEAGRAKAVIAAKSLPTFVNRDNLTRCSDYCQIDRERRTTGPHDGDVSTH